MFSLSLIGIDLGYTMLVMVIIYFEAGVGMADNNLLKLNNKAAFPVAILAQGLYALF